jgi:hypothetical protein
VRNAWRIALALALIGCNEWVALAPEPEAYPLATAKRICHAHAEREASRGPGYGPGGERIDPATYRREFSRCMRAHGWELRRKRHAPGAEADQRAG